MALGMTYSGSFGPQPGYTSAAGYGASGGGYGSTMGGALSIAGAVNSVLGAYFSAQAAKQQAQFSAQLTNLQSQHAVTMTNLQMQGMRSQMEIKQQGAAAYAAHMATMSQMTVQQSRTAIASARLTGQQETMAMQHQMAMQRLGLEYEAGMASVNAEIAELGARSALLQGERQEQAARLNTAQIKSSQRASMAANGIDLASDTPVRNLTGTDLMGEADAITIRTNAARTAWGYRTQSVNASNEAAMAGAMASTIDPSKAEKLANPFVVDPKLIAADYSSVFSGFKTPALPNFPTMNFTPVPSAGSAISPLMSGATSLLGSATDLYGKWYAFKQGGG